MKQILLIIPILALGGSLNTQPLIKRTQVLMGTYVSISLPAEELVHAKPAFNRIKKVEKALSSYNEEAEIYRLNHEREVALSSDSYEALSLCQKYYKDTGRYFDITIGSITKGLFHFGEKEVIPNFFELNKAKIDFKGLHFNKQRAWLNKGIKVDLGGMGKGFGVDKAVSVLKKKGIKKGVVSLSGDIYCIHQCEMLIQNPFYEGILARFTMAQNNTAISTSGNYRRYVINTNYNHLINPKTRQSQRIFASITLVSDELSNSDLDAYATAASVMSYKEAIRFLDAQPLGYLLVTNTKELKISKRLKELIQGFSLFSLEDPRKQGYLKVNSLKSQNSKRISP